MRSYRWVTDTVCCPYYKEQDAQIIYCQGSSKDFKYHVAFATPRLRKEFQNKYCKTNEFCPLAKALDEEWESNES